MIVRSVFIRQGGLFFVCNLFAFCFFYFCIFFFFELLIRFPLFPNIVLIQNLILLNQNLPITQHNLKTLTKKTVIHIYSLYALCHLAVTCWFFFESMAFSKTTFFCFLLLASVFFTFLSLASPNNVFLKRWKYKATIR